VKRSGCAACIASALILLAVAASSKPREEAAPQPERCSAPSPIDPALDVSDDAGPEARALARTAREALESARFEDLDLRIAAAHESASQVGDAATRAHLLIHVARTAERFSDRQPDPSGARRLMAAQSFRAAAQAAAGVDERLHAYALGYLAEMYEQDGRDEEALELTRRALFAAQTDDALDALYRLQWQLARLEHSAGRTSEAIAAYRRAVATLTELRTQTAFGSRGSEAAFRSEVAPVYTGLVDLLLTRARSSTDADSTRGLLLEARGALEDLKAAELRDHFRDPCLTSHRRAAAEEIPGAVVVYPVLLPDRVELIVSRGRQVTSYSVPVDGATMSERTRVLRRLLGKRTTRQYLPHAQQLYDWLIRPIRPSLGGSVDALVFVPDGALRTIPFAALHDRDEGVFLIEQFALAITPGVDLTEPRPLDRESVRLLAAGISQSVQGFPPLEGVEREMASLHALFGGEQLMNQDLQVERFSESVSERPFGIVHIASHGEFSADSADSFLLAYDGKVSMDRLADMVGTTRFRQDQPLELLTLSACQTAAGDERAALGLAGVAVRSGARSALATLWSVNDQASTDLITDFYTQLQDPDVSRAEALRRAQIALLHLQHYRHPAYWSPFLMINSWL
jgi:CHAT domain-containing protein